MQLIVCTHFLLPILTITRTLKLTQFNGLILQHTCIITANSISSGRSWAANCVRYLQSIAENDYVLKDFQRMCEYNDTIAEQDVFHLGRKGVS